MRIDRVNSEIKKELSAIILNEINDERINDAMISITGVETTQDLKYAKVFVSVLAGDKKEALAALNGSAGFFKNELFKRLRIRAVPSFTFIADDSLEYGAKIEKILKDISKDNQIKD